MSEYSQYPKDTDDVVSAQLKLTYDGPLRQSSGQKNNIRVDIALDEVIISDPVPRKLAMEYDDDIGIALSVYSLEEIVAEKMRSILQRGKSRDYYDTWVLLTHHGSDFDRNRALVVLLQKCQSKGIPQPKVEHFFRSDQLVEAQGYWERGLAHQLSDLPTFSSVTKSLRNEIRKLLSR